MDVVDEKSLGKVLQAARQKAGLTQQQLCQKAQLSYSTLAKIERGAIKAPSIFTIRTIAEVLGTSLDALAGTSPSKTGLRQKTKSGVSFIFFDINGCLVRFFHRAFVTIAKETGAAPDVIETAFWRYNDAICTGKLSLSDFNKTFAKDLGVPSIDWQKHYLNAVDPIAEMHELVRWAAQHYQVGLMSNIGKGFIEDMLQHELLPHVDYAAVVDSSKVGEIKPHAKIYEVAEKMAGVPAQEILLIDDSRANLIPAQERGWHVMWFNDYDPLESTERVRSALEPAAD